MINEFLKSTKNIELCKFKKIGLNQLEHMLKSQKQKLQKFKQFSETLKPKLILILQNISSIKKMFLKF